MGAFLHVILFPGGDGWKCRAAIQHCARNAEWAIQPEECGWHICGKGCAVLLNDGCQSYEAPSELSTLLDCPVMQVYTYDDDFWGYELWQGGVIADEFISAIDYFGEDDPPHPGDTQIVGLCFGVEPERIERYLLPWEEDAMGSYAYEGDGAAIGDSWQMADFLDALGFDFDQLCPEEPEQKAPNQTSIPIPEPPPPPEPQPHRDCIDTPVLPNALTNRAYALLRAEALGEDFSEIARFLRLGQYQKAVNLLSESIEAGPDNPALYLLRAFCWNQLECVSVRSRRPDMDRDLTKALELEPGNIMALRGRCPTAATSARYQRHIQDLTRLLELDPENGDLYRLDRAYRYHWVGDDASARADLEEICRRGTLWTVDFVYLCREFGFPGF